MLLLQDSNIYSCQEDTTLVNEISTSGSIQSSDYKSCSKPVMTIYAPYDEAVHDSGDIFVMSNDDHCVHSFDNRGRKKAAIGSQSSGDVQFGFLITSITINGDVMFVTDLSSHRIPSQVNFW